LPSKIAPECAAFLIVINVFQNSGAYTTHPRKKNKNARLHKEARAWLWVLGGQAMRSDFTVFHGHLAEACRDRKKTPDPLCAAAMDLHFAGVRALDVYRLAKIADELNVSVDWLLGRSDMMELPRHPR
jgi:hypothetical protein